MTGAQRRHIKAHGTEYTVRNAPQGSSARDVSAYSDDGSLRAVIQERRRPQRESDSAGEELEAGEELRAVVRDNVDIYEPGHADQKPTRLKHPRGITYEVVGRRFEDGGMTVLQVVRP